MEELERQEPGFQEDVGDVQVDTAPDVEPEPVAEEPELPPVNPDWLAEAGVPEYEEPRYQQQQYQQQPTQQQWQQAQQQTPGVMTDAQIEQFVKDPDAYIGRLVQARVEQAMGPLAMQAMQTSQGVGSFIAAQAETSISTAKKAVADAYRDVFNQDEAFRGNRELQERVGGSLRGLLEQAARGARSGNFNDIALFQSFGPAQARATLAAAKALMGLPGKAGAPMNVAGAMVERATPKAVKGDVQLSAEEESAIAARSRVEPGYRERYIAAKQEAIKRGDFAV